MKKERTLTEEYLECDGCGYLMGTGKPAIIVSVPFDYPIQFLQEDRTLEFHFHALEQRHDCFRYWAHNPHVMRQSLKQRQFNEQQIDDFMKLMLYREDAFHPGIPTEKKAVSA